MATLKTDWTKAAGPLGLDVVAPFSVTLASGTQVHAEVLVRDFGATEGMLIVQEFDEIVLLQGELLAAGFGYSVIRESPEGEPFDLESFKEVLRDWGWAGSPASPPPWW